MEERVKQQLVELKSSLDRCLEFLLRQKSIVSLDETNEYLRGYADR